MKAEIERIATQTELGSEAHATFRSFLTELEAGRIRAAEPDPASPFGWRTNAWVKSGILTGFRMGALVPMPRGFWDKHTYPVREFTLEDSVRLVPGGSSVRSGAHLASGVVMMPPSYVNVGAFVGSGTMIDSHVLVGSCAQVGERVHLSAGVQVGGVLEPINASPVIIEDDVMVGGNGGLYEGVIVKRGAVLGSGVILTRSTPIYNLVTGEIHRAENDQPLVVPENAVIVPGSRPARGELAEKWGVSLYAPILVKYRDPGTDQRVQLEAYLR